MANIGSIIESAQTMDRLLLELLGGSCAIEIAPHPRARCVSRAAVSAGSDAPFGDAWCAPFTLPSRGAP
jgi:hypothetical protein